MTHDNQAEVRARFNRRFAFGLHAMISLTISVLLFVISFTHPLNIAIWYEQEVWMGYARPDLMYIASLMVGIVGAHGSWLLWREERLNKRALRFSLHLVSTIISFALVFTFITSWYFSESYKWVDYVPVSAGEPSQIVITLVMLMTALLTVTLPIHALWLLYKTLLARTLQKADDTETKRKREERLSVVGDDGELMEWAEREIKAKRQS
jgi:hypothetical protein